MRNRRTFSLLESFLFGGRLFTWAPRLHPSYLFFSVLPPFAFAHFQSGAWRFFFFKRILTLWAPSPAIRSPTFGPLQHRAAARHCSHLPTLIPFASLFLGGGRNF